MAFLIPQNIPSRNDIPRRLQTVARAMRKLPEEITVWLERPTGGERRALALEFDLDREPTPSPDDDPYLVLFDPAAGVAVIEAPSRHALARLGVRAIRRKLDLSQIRNDVQARAEKLRNQLNSNTNRRKLNSLPIRRIIAMPEVDRRRIPMANQTVALLTRENFEKGDMRKAIHRILGGNSPSLTEEDESIVRAVVNPRVIISDRANHQQRRFMFDPPTLSDSSQAVAVLDRRQERLAMSLGPGYRMIRGVAGSGKTLVLTYRARYIADHFPSSRILLLCFNRALSLALKNEVSSTANVTVKTVDKLAFDLLRREKGWLARIQNEEEWRQRILDAKRAADGLSDSDKYDLVLVDEAQDLETSHLDLAYAMLKSDKDHFVMALDSAQNIYRRRMTWNPPELTARGRTTILRRNYRNTLEILDVGMDVLLGKSRRDDPTARPDDPDALVTPEAAERSGPAPQLLQCANPAAEVAQITRMVKAKLNAGVEERHILVMADSKYVRSLLLRAFEGAGINSLNAQWRKNHGLVLSKTTGVRIAGLRVLKGLEFPHVFLGGANHVKVKDVDSRKLLYVAITRATETLTITFSGRGPMADALRVARTRTN